MNAKKGKNRDFQGYDGTKQNNYNYGHIHKKVKEGLLRETGGYFLHSVDQVLTKKLGDGYCFPSFLVSRSWRETFCQLPVA